MVETRSHAAAPPASFSSRSAETPGDLAHPDGAASFPISVLVTGGNGFLGWHLVSALASDSARWRVKVFDVRPPREPRADVTYVVGDLRSDADVAAALEGVRVVFHAATAAPTAANSLDRGLMEAVNVAGTRRVLSLSSRAGVEAVVFTSSASVVFAGKPLRGADESQPYADPPADRYTETKIAGERAVLEAGARWARRQQAGERASPDSDDDLPAIKAVALRPSGIFGEHDALAVPEIARNAAAGKLRFVLGDGSNRADWTYAGNVAQAHVLAAEALLGIPGADASSPSPPTIASASDISGRAFFVTNDEPRPFWSFMGDVVEGLGYDRPSRHLPFWPIYLLALLVHHVIVPLLSPFVAIKSDFSPSRVLLATTDRVFSCEAAKRDLGYRPAVSLEEGLRRTLDFFSYLRKQDAGNGKVRAE